MITQEHAKSVAQRVLDEPDPYWPDRPPLIITNVEAHRLGWLFYYQSQEYLRTGDFSTILAGNGPILVSSEDGRYVRVGTAPPFAERIAEAERQLLGASTRPSQ